MTVTFFSSTLTSAFVLAWPLSLQVEGPGEVELHRNLAWEAAWEEMVEQEPLRPTPKFRPNELKKINKVIQQKVNQHTTDAAAAKVS